MSTHRVTLAGYMAGVLHLCQYAQREGIAPFRGEEKQRDILRQIVALIENVAAPNDPQDDAACFVFLSEVLATEADCIVGEATEQWREIASRLDWQDVREAIERAFNPDEEE